MIFKAVAIKHLARVFQRFGLAIASFMTSQYFVVFPAFYMARVAEPFLSHARV